MDIGKDIVDGYSVQVHKYERGVLVSIAMSSVSDNATILDISQAMDDVKEYLSTWEGLACDPKAEI